MNKSKVPSLVSIVILTAITSVFWIFFSVYRVFATKPAPKVSEEVLAPISADLDRTTIDQIQARIFFEENQIPEISTVASPSPTASPTASPSATLAPTPTATASATPTP